MKNKKQTEIEKKIIEKQAMCQFCKKEYFYGVCKKCELYMEIENMKLSVVK